MEERFRAVTVASKGDETEADLDRRIDTTHCGGVERSKPFDQATPIDRSDLIVLNSGLSR